MKSNSILFMSLVKNVLNNQMGEKKEIKAKSLSLLSFLCFNVQSNWCFKSISSLSVLVSKYQCFRGGSILFYLELLFLGRKLLFFFPLYSPSREVHCIPTDLCLIFYCLLTLLINYLHFPFKISWEIKLAGHDIENACLFQVYNMAGHCP